MLSNVLLLIGFLLSNVLLLIGFLFISNKIILFKKFLYIEIFIFRSNRIKMLANILFLQFDMELSLNFFFLTAITHLFPNNLE